MNYFLLDQIYRKVNVAICKTCIVLHVEVYFALWEEICI